jgi:hypothetical protein
MGCEGLDKVIFELPIPQFDAKLPTDSALAARVVCTRSSSFSLSKRAALSLIFIVAVHPSSSFSRSRAKRFRCAAATDPDSMSTYNYELREEQSEGEAPGIRVFIKDEHGDIFAAVRPNQGRPGKNAAASSSSRLPCEHRP